MGPRIRAFPTVPVVEGSAEGLGRAPDERDRPGGVERGGSGYNRATLLDHAFPASARRSWSRWLSSCQAMSVTKSSTVRRPRRGWTTAAMPLFGRQRGEMSERPLAQAAERRERLGGIVAKILPVLGPAIGGGRLAVGLQRQHPRAHAGGSDQRLVHGGDRLQAEEEHFLGIAQVADDFLRSPARGLPAAGRAPPRAGRESLPRARRGSAPGGPCAARAVVGPPRHGSPSCPPSPEQTPTRVRHGGAYRLGRIATKRCLRYQDRCA